MLTSDRKERMSELYQNMSLSSVHLTDSLTTRPTPLNSFFILDNVDATADTIGLGSSCETS